MVDEGVCVGVLSRGILVCSVWSRDQKKDCDEGDDEVMVKGGTVWHREQQHGTLGDGSLW